MNIQNCRLGFATNSSSTHSIVIIPNNMEVSDDIDTDCYGWENFTLSSERLKTEYFAVTLYHNFINLYGVNIADILIESFYPHIFDDFIATGIDHQSLITLPCNYSLKPSINMDFYNEFKNYIVQGNTAIIGGNDNSDESHFLSDLSNSDVYSFVEFDSPEQSLVAIKDKTYNFWTIFNRFTGAKTIFTFDKTLNPIEKSSAPHLVDLKITDFCPYNCDFCYQDSTTSGKNAESSVINSIIQSLGVLETLEIVLGGGEPTLHPDFIDIVKYIHSKNIACSFTTKNLSLFSQPYFLEFISNYCRSFAFSPSVNNYKKELNSLYNYVMCIDIQVSIHLILGVYTKDEFYDITKLAFTKGFNVTILGFKNFGRGEEYLCTDTAFFPEYLEHFVTDGYYISIDTVVVEQFKTELVDMNVPKSLFYNREGAFSCYIDAVEKTISPSSFSENVTKIEHFNPTTISEQFKTYL